MDTPGGAEAQFDAILNEINNNEPAEGVSEVNADDRKTVKKVKADSGRGKENGTLKCGISDGNGDISGISGVLSDSKKLDIVDCATISNDKCSENQSASNDCVSTKGQGLDNETHACKTDPANISSIQNQNQECTIANNQNECASDTVAQNSATSAKNEPSDCGDSNGHDKVNEKVESESNLVDNSGEIVTELKDANFDKLKDMSNVENVTDTENEEIVVQNKPEFSEIEHTDKGDKNESIKNDINNKNEVKILADFHKNFSDSDSDSEIMDILETSVDETDDMISNRSKSTDVDALLLDFENKLVLDS